LRQIEKKARMAGTITSCRDLISEPVWKLRGVLRRGILAVAKAARSEHPRSVL
jgi:hypothetical protein